VEPSIDESAAALLATDPSGRNARWNELYERVAPTLVSWTALHLHGAMRQRIDPADVTQEAWLRALQAIDSYSPERGPFVGWVIGIARNVLRGAFAQVANRREASGGTSAFARLGEQADEVTSVTQRIARDDSLTAFIEKLREQEEADQVLVLTCGLERAPVAEAALRLGISVEAATKRWQRLRERLAVSPFAARLLADGAA
jgi:RNA polymerase sigma-70 factor (ECF subfamily)